MPSAGRDRDFEALFSLVGPGPLRIILGWRSAALQVAAERLQKRLPKLVVGRFSTPFGSELFASDGFTLIGKHTGGGVRDCSLSTSVGARFRCSPFSVTQGPTSSTMRPSSEPLAVTSSSPGVSETFPSSPLHRNYIRATPRWRRILCLLHAPKRPCNAFLLSPNGEDGIIRQSSSHHPACFKGSTRQSRSNTHIKLASVLSGSRAPPSRR